MKIRTNRPTEAPHHIHARVEGQDQYWMLLRPGNDPRFIDGYIASDSGTQLDDVRPVRVTLRDNVQQRYMTDPGLCALVLSNLYGIRIESPDLSKQGADTNRGMDLWQDFLVETGQARKDQVIKRDDLLSDEYLDIMRDMGVHLGPAGTSVFQVQSSNFSMREIGKVISGFDAMKIQLTVSKSFEDVLEPRDLDIDEAKKALRAVSRPSSQAVLWYAKAPDPDTALVRSQAAQSFPILADWIATSPAVSRKVDSREPINEMISQHTGLTPASFKRLRNITQPLPAEPLFNRDERITGEDALGVTRARRFHVSAAASRETCLSVLSEMPPDWAPRDNAGWQAFHDVLAGAAIPLSNTGNISVQACMKAGKGNWVDFRDSLARAADIPPEDFDLRRVSLTALDTIEMIDMMSRTVVLPTVINAISSTGQALPNPDEMIISGANDETMKYLTGSAKNPLSTLFEKTRRFVSRIGNIADLSGDHEISAHEGFDDEFGLEGFPKFFEDFQASNDLIVTHLNRKSLFSLESSRLNHCVGKAPGYFRNSFVGSQMILSIQDANRSTSLATVSISSNTENKDFSDIHSAPELARALMIGQASGECNRAPPENARNALSEWKEALANDRIALNTEECHPRWEQARASDPLQGGQSMRRITWNSVIGFQFQNDERINEIWQQWSHVISGRENATPHSGALFKHKGFRDLLAEMSPAAAGVLSERERERKAAQDQTPDAPSIS